MFHQRTRSSRLFIIVLLITAFCPVLMGSETSAITMNAFTTGGPRWPQGARTIYFSVDPTSDSHIATGATDLIQNNSAVRWTSASELSLIPTTYPSSNYVSWFNDITKPLPSHCDQIPPTVPALTCFHTNSNNVLLDAQAFFRYDPTNMIWVTDGSHCETCTPRRYDFQTVSLHEFGHWMYLNHNCSDYNNSMCVGDRAAQRLTDDDKQGATELYGPWTGWEFTLLGSQPWLDQTQGQANWIDGQQNVQGYNYPNPNPATPRLWTKSADTGVPVLAGTTYLRTDGYAPSGSPYSYVNFKLISEEHDRASTRNYLTIQSGMKLKWYQYNAQQNTMSLDLKFSDGSFMRDYATVVDQNGIRVHPARRGSYPTGQWLYFEVNLTPVANKVIERYQVGFDNSMSGNTGQFRAYFDNIQISYP